MKILILGARGNLGHQLAKVFSEHEVIGLGSSELDITNAELVLEEIRSTNPEIIINTAAYNAVDKCEQDEKEFELALRINGEAPGVLAQAAFSYGATLVHYSTDYVFGGDKKEGYTEDSTSDPINKYGRTKLAGENNILALGPSGLKYYIIRTSRLFGPQGESVNSKQNFFDVIFKKIGEQQEVNVVDDEVASFAYTPDIAKATKELLLGRNNYGIYHLVNSGSASWYDVAVELIKILGADKHSIKAVSGILLPRPAKRPKNSVLQNTKISPLRSWQDALHEYASQYKLM